MEYVNDAVQAAKMAGDFLKEVFLNKEVEVEYKSKNEIVTSADKGSEEIVIEYLSERFPKHRIVSEERGITGNKESEYTWYVDPLDGTSNFYHHIPFFNVSISLERNNELICGAIYNPLLGEMFYAEKGAGAFLNGKPIRPSENSVLKRAFFTACHSRDEKDITMFIKTVEAFKRKANTIRQVGAAALELCYTACGRVDGFIGLGIKPWDFKGGLIVCREAGCKIGGVYSHEIENNNLLVSSPALYSDVRKIIDDIIK